MKKSIMRADFATPAAEASSQIFDSWFEPIESGVRRRMRDFIETIMAEQPDAMLSRPRQINTPASTLSTRDQSAS
jgi:hypothetical protein